MDNFILTKIKEYTKKTPIAFQHRISQNASKIFKDLESEPLSVDLLEANIFQIVRSNYKYFNIATEFIESLESCDSDRLADIINHLHVLPRINERNENIIRLRLIDKKTFEQTGNIHNISRERVRQIIGRSLDTILHYMGLDHNDDMFEKYYELIRIQSRKDR